MKLSWSQRAHAAWTGFRAAATGVWEGHEPNRLRYRPAQELKSQDQSLQYGTRERMLSEARSLGNTFPIIPNILDKYSNYIVGTCEANWNTGDLEIDNLYQENWRQGMAIMDARARHSFQEQSKIAVACWKLDGDVFAQLADRNSFGAVALIEADRVTNGSSGVSMDTDTNIGGVEINSDGQPIAYQIWDRTKWGGFANSRKFPARDIVHLFRTRRADACRGVTVMAPVINFVRDVKEIIDSERTAVKVNSRIALLIKNAIGQAPADVNPFADNATTSNVTDVQEIAEGAVQYMFPNESVDAHSPNRPSATWQGFMQFLLMLISQGMGLPYGVVWSMTGLSGPSVRFEIRSAERVITADQDAFERIWLKRVCGWKTAKDIATGRVPFHPYWFKFSFQRPAFLSIDAGRDSKAGIEENRAGLLTAQGWYAESGQDWQERIEQLAKEADFRNQMLAKYPGIKLEDIRLITPNLQPQEAENKEPQKEQTA